MSLKVSKMKMKSVIPMSSQEDDLSDIEASLSKLRVSIGFYAIVMHVLFDLVAKMAHLSIDERRALVQYMAEMLTTAVGGVHGSVNNQNTAELVALLEAQLPVYITGLATPVITPLLSQFFMDRVRTSMCGSD